MIRPLILALASSTTSVLPSCAPRSQPAPIRSPADSAPAPFHTMTPEGLRIDDTAVGRGTPCPAGAAVTIEFTASFTDGRAYDSSAQRRRPLTLDLDDPGLIRGLREGIPGMRVSGKRRLTIPWLLAYGEAGRDPIPPKTDLVFEIELLEFRE